jgi:hypothetical protein
MKTVRQKLRNEIEYLRALAELCECERDPGVREATLRAIEALEQLSITIEDSSDLLQLAA